LATIISLEEIYEYAGWECPENGYINMSVQHAFVQAKWLHTQYMICNGKTLMGGMTNLLKELTLLLHQVNLSLKHTVPNIHAKLLQFHWKHLKAGAVMEAIAHIDPLFMEGRELLYNVRLTEHVDTKDPPHGMAVFTVFGNFTGGNICYPELGVSFQFQPGDLQLLRGKHSR
jgi:hypothetical protein